nr:SMI1/KNR4 family protein [Fimbriiglobus sp.]
QTAGFLVLRLNGLAEGLDPVWVARVSRPPVGVCADDAGIREASPGVSAERLDSVEHATGVKLPIQFRAFLQNWAGGKPKAFMFRNRGYELGPLGRFIWCGESSGFDLVMAITTWQRSRNTILHRMIPICDTDCGARSSLVAVRYGKENTGVVYHVHDSYVPYLAEEPSRLADSLSSFLAALTEPDPPTGNKQVDFMA